jgi:hypothetical protein
VYGPDVKAELSMDRDRISSGVALLEYWGSKVLFRIGTDIKSCEIAKLDIEISTIRQTQCSFVVNNNRAGEMIF